MRQGTHGFDRLFFIHVPTIFHELLKCQCTASLPIFLGQSAILAGSEHNQRRKTKPALAHEAAMIQRRVLSPSLACGAETCASCVVEKPSRTVVWSRRPYCGDPILSNDTTQWQPPESFEEKLRGALIPPSLYYVLRARREYRRGEAELRLLPFLIDPTRTAVDAGANKGVYTYWLERLSAHVHAYEPNPKMLKVLKGGAGAKATVHHAALSDQAGQFALRIPKTGKGRYSNQGASLNHAKVGDRYGEVMVETRRLDDEVLGDIGFIKIDVEGHEMAVLDGAVATIQRDRPTLLIEMEQKHTKRPIEDDLKRVTDLGYRMVFLHRGVLFSGDRFDAQTHHTNAASAEDYVFNFIFLPMEKPL